MSSSVSTAAREVAQNSGDIAGGNKSQARWRTADTVERLEVRELDCQFLFKEADMYTFMDTSSYEQFSLSGELIGEKAGFLQDNMDVTVDFIEGKPVSVNLPGSVVLTVVEADPVVKGQTASSSYKPAMLDNGVRVFQVSPGVVRVMGAENNGDGSTSLVNGQQFQDFL